MPVDVFYAALGIVPRLLRRLAASVASFQERRAAINQLSGMSDRELADIGLSRGASYAVFDLKVAQEPRALRPVLDDAEEQVLADLGLSRRFPFPAAG